MFVKPLVKYNKTTKKRYDIYQLCESFRLDGRVRHRVVIGLGKLEELEGDEPKKLLGKRIEELIIGQTNRLLTPSRQEITLKSLHDITIVKYKRNMVMAKGTRQKIFKLSTCPP